MITERHPGEAQWATKLNKRMRTWEWDLQEGGDMSQVEGRQERGLGNNQNAVYTYIILPKIYYF